MTARYVLGIDVGTTALKAIALEREKGIVAQTDLPHELRPVAAHWVHGQDGRDQHRVGLATGFGGGLVSGATGLARQSVAGNDRDFAPGLASGSNRTDFAATAGPARSHWPVALRQLRIGHRVYLARRGDCVDGDVAAAAGALSA